MARARPAIDPTLFIGVITKSNLNEVQEQPTLVGYHAQADAVIAAVNSLMASSSSDVLVYLLNTATAARSELSLKVQEHYVSEIRTFANVYYDELAAAPEPHFTSPEASVITINADQNAYARKLIVKRSAIRRMDIVLRMTRGLPSSTLRALNAEQLANSMIVMRNKRVLVSKRALQREAEFIRWRNKRPGRYDDNLLLNEFYIAQALNKEVNVSWLATAHEVVLLSDNRIKEVALATSVETVARYPTLAAKVKAEVAETLRPHRHLVSEQSQSFIVRQALYNATIDADKARLRAQREAVALAAERALLRPGHIRLTGHAATLVAGLKRELATTLADACQLPLDDALVALTHNRGAALAQEHVRLRSSMSLSEKQQALDVLRKTVRHWHELSNASRYGIAPSAVHRLLNTKVA